MKEFLSPFKIRLYLLALFIFILAACHSSRTSFPSLSNQGVLPISPTNAYLGSNLFIGQEAEKSRVLYQFLKGRGAPGAIEINHKDYKSESLLLYYPKQSHFYVAELESSKHSYEWIVRGPFAIERETFRKLNDIQRYNYEASPIIIGGEIMSFVKIIPTALPTQTAVVTISPKVAKKSKSSTSSKVQTKPTAALSPIAVVPTLAQIPSGPGLNSDQQALRLANGLVELSAEGDLLHRVNSDQETWQQIATWYTADAAKAKAIAEFNGLTDSTPLSKNAKIKIPKALSTNEKVLR
jgi:hypothetical protein